MRRCRCPRPASPASPRYIGMAHTRRRGMAKREKEIVAQLAHTHTHAEPMMRPEMKTREALSSGRPLKSTGATKRRCRSPSRADTPGSPLQTRPVDRAVPTNPPAAPGVVSTCATPSTERPTLLSLSFFFFPSLLLGCCALCVWSHETPGIARALHSRVKLAGSSGGRLGDSGASPASSAWEPTRREGQRQGKTNRFRGPGDAAWSHGSQGRRSPKEEEEHELRPPTADDRILKAERVGPPSAPQPESRHKSF
ncbi:hypothetical protein BDY21DRAFT_205053 [Lineolata rhizophorae]|uniref:Uncharacterized protein n=1 Tax=Lineolata rhizophorae TaxID=578093 RepID=A0A6A6P3D9_9PEZI|nr:hypothetical protein BDY21DRAFT_205053 [Lineolata rhizophorae]